MAGEPQARRARRFECRALRRRGVADLIARKIEADHPAAREASRFARERDVVLRRVLPHGTDDGDRIDRSGANARQYRGYYLLGGQAIAQVKSWSPADFEVVDILRR